VFNKIKEIKYEDHPNFKNKGKMGLRCNRTACENTEAYWYNRTTRAYYCQPCAHAINEASNFVPPLLSLAKDAKEEWNNEIMKRRKI